MQFIKIPEYSCLLFICFCIHAFSPAQTPVSGTLSGFLPASGSPYLVEGDIIIDDNTTLTIEPGTTFDFQGFYSIIVNGCLLAVGTLTDTILFTYTGVPDTCSNGLLSWDGIKFPQTGSNNDSSILEYCHFTNIKDGYLYGKKELILVDRFDKLRVSHCLFTNSSSCLVEVDSASFIFSNNRIENNVLWFYHLFTSDSAQIKFLGNRVENNYRRTGNSLSLWKSDVVIINNEFIHNTTYYGGTQIMCDSCKGNINSNLFTENYNTNVEPMNPDYTLGGTMCLFDSELFIVNNTFYDNYAGWGGAIAFQGTGNYALVNNIFSNDTALYDHNHLWANTAVVVELSYCLFNDSIQFSGSNITAYNILETNPLYADTAAGDFSLSSVSPCINAGNPDTTGLGLPAFDLKGNPRLFGGRIDMGAIESDVTMNIICPDREQDILIYPNPADSRIVAGCVDGGKYDSFSIYTTTGAVVQTGRINGNPVEIDVSGLTCGTYLICLIRPGSSECRVFVLK
ncbi:MAG: choice-of-anchor Q domain-containing protein [Bacteroidota bacterium]